jgi:Protein of unknown function (DUF1566)
MKTITLFLFGFLFLPFATTKAQVGIGTTTPTSSAQLDVTSTSKGLLPPRMTRLQRNSISSPVAGLMIWCTNCSVAGQVQVFDGTGWTNMIGGLDLAIGDYYGGGKVAYILQPADPGYVVGQIHGFIATAIDQPGVSPWGCPGILVGGTSAALGTGQANTTLIVNACGTGNAASVCNDLIVNGYSDWYLPSKDELNKLYINQVVIGGFDSFNHWSSTESDATFAYGQYFVNGQAGVNYKYNSSDVRAIRSF